MGVYYSVVNPAKRQFMDIGILGNSKLSGLMVGLHARAIGLLLWDERRSDEWPFSLIGSWAGDMVYFTHDEEPAIIVRSATEYVLPYCIDSRTPTKPDRNLYLMALEQFEEISADMIALVYEFQPEIMDRFADWIERSHEWFVGPEPRRCQRSGQRILETINKLVDRCKVHRPVAGIPRCYCLDERFLMVQPATKQYVSAGRLGEHGDLRHLLGGWHGKVFGWWLQWGDWKHTDSRLGPVYAAGELSMSFPPGSTPPPGASYRNLYECALAEYTEVSFRFFQCMNDYHRCEIVAEARENQARFVALGNAVFEEDLPLLQAEITKQLGARWLDRYIDILGGGGLQP